MERTERNALIGAGIGHLLLLAALSVGLLHSRKLPPMEEQIAVDITDIGPVAAAPSTAPAIAPAPETPPPAPSPDQAQAEPEQTPPTPAPPRPVPPPKPAPQKPSPEKPAPETPAPAKPAPAKPSSAKPSPVKLNTPPAPSGKSRLGKDFLGRVLGDAKPSANVVDARAVASLAQAIAAQVRPCWVIPTGPGTEQLNTTLRIRFNINGTVNGRPEVVEQTGANDSNRGYLRQHSEAAIRAALRCSPLKLPPDMYDQWKDIAFDFNSKLAN